MNLSDVALVGILVCAIDIAYNLRTVIRYEFEIGGVLVEIRNCVEKLEQFHQDRFLDEVKASIEASNKKKSTK